MHMHPTHEIYSMAVTCHIAYTDLWVLLCDEYDIAQQSAAVWLILNPGAHPKGESWICPQMEMGESCL